MTGDGVLLDEGIGTDEKRFLGQIMLTQFEWLATLPPDEVHDVIDDALAATFDIDVGILDEPEGRPCGPFRWAHGEHHARPAQQMQPATLAVPGAQLVAGQQDSRWGRLAVQQGAPGGRSGECPARARRGTLLLLLPFRHTIIIAVGTRPCPTVAGRFSTADRSGIG